MEYFKNRKYINKMSIFIASIIIVIILSMFEKIEAIFSLILMPPLLISLLFIIIFVLLFFIFYILNLHYLFSVFVRFYNRLQKISVSITKLFTVMKIGCAIIVCTFISGILWIWLSYYSYYDGLHSSTNQDNHFFIKKAEKIFNNKNCSFEEQINQYKLITEVSISGITITNLDNNSEYTIKTPLFRQDGNQFTLYVDVKNSKIINSNFGRLKVEFIYSVAPKVKIGILRAMSCSLSDIFFTGGSLYNNLNFKNRLKQWGKDYFITENHKRSKNFYRSFFVSLVLYFVILGLYEKQKFLNKKLSYKNEQLKNTNNKLKETNNKLKEFHLRLENINNDLKNKNIELENTSAELTSSNQKLLKTNQELEEFKTIHSKMYSDLSNEINQLKQPLQVFDFSWDNYVYTIFKAEKHDLENNLSFVCNNTKFSELEIQIINKIKTKYFDEQKQTILKAIKELPIIVQYELKEETAKETLNSIMKQEEAIPLGFENGTAENFEFVKINNFVPKENEHCLINKHRLSSIIFNVLTNANVATQNYADDLDSDLLDTYIRTIWMKIDRFIEDNGNNFIRVSIEDNAGGIPNDKINKIYKKQIDSSKIINGEKRKGEGTIYVAFFARYMKIKIKVENYMAKDGNKGAKVHLFIPIYKKGE